MDYRDNLYPKIPFYMTYPMQNMYLTEMEYEKDIERMKSYFPTETQQIMKMVEDRLDELEYEGSRIYDEEPDRLMIQREVEQLYQKMVAEEIPSAQESDIPSYFEMVPMAIGGPPRGRNPHGDRPHGGRPHDRDCRDDWLCSMVGVLFGTELYRRRCRHRRCRRWW